MFQHVFNLHPYGACNLVADTFLLDIQFIAEIANLYDQLEEFDGVAIRASFLESILIVLLAFEVAATVLFVYMKQSTRVFQKGTAGHDDDLVPSLACVRYWLYCSAPLCDAASGREQVLEANDTLKLMKDGPTYSVTEIIQGIKFVTSVGTKPVVQAVLLSAVSGVVQEAIILGATDRTAADFLSTSAVLFALSLAGGLFSAMMFAYRVTSTYVGTKIKTSAHYGDKLRRALEEEGQWPPEPDCVQSVRNSVQDLPFLLQSRSRVSLKSPASFISIAAAMAVGGALLLAVSMGSVYYDVSVAFEAEEIDIFDPSQGRLDVPDFPLSQHHPGHEWSGIQNGVSTGDSETAWRGVSARQPQTRSRSLAGDYHAHANMPWHQSARSLQNSAAIDPSNSTGVGNETSNATAIAVESSIDGAGARVLYNILTIRSVATFLSIGNVFFIGMFAIVSGIQSTVIGLYGLGVQLCQQHGDGDGEANQSGGTRSSSNEKLRRNSNLGIEPSVSSSTAARIPAPASSPDSPAGTSTKISDQMSLVAPTSATDDSSTHGAVTDAEDDTSKDDASASAADEAHAGQAAGVTATLEDYGIEKPSDTPLGSLYLGIVQLAIGLVFIPSFSLCFIGLFGAGAAGGFAFSVWVARGWMDDLHYLTDDVLESAGAMQTRSGSNTVLSEAERDRVASCWCFWKFATVRMWFPTVLPDSKYEPNLKAMQQIAGSDRSSLHGEQWNELKDRILTHRKLVQSMWAAQWIQNRFLLAAGLDLLLGIYGLSNSAVQDALSSKVLDGYRVAIVCAVVGMSMVGIATMLSAVVWWSGVLRAPILQPGDYLKPDFEENVGKMLIQSFFPAVLSNMEAAVLDRDKNWLILCENHSGSVKELEGYVESKDVDDVQRTDRVVGFDAVVSASSDAMRKTSFRQSASGYV